MNPANFPDYLIAGTVPVNTGTPDRYGNYWWYKTLKGWASPDARVQMLQVVSQDGEIPADLHYRGRSIQMTGWVECPNETARENARYLLSGALDLLYGPGLFLAREVVPKQASVLHAGNNNSGLVSFDETGFPIRVAAMLVRSPAFRQVTDGALSSSQLISASAAFTSADLNQTVWDLAGLIPIGTTITGVVNSTTVNLSNPVPTASGLLVGIGSSGGLPNGIPAYTADWDIELYAQDPRKYSVTPHSAAFSGGSVSCTDAGNAKIGTGPVVTVTTGGNDPILLQNATTGKTLRLHAVSPLAMPSTVIVDFTAKTITDGGGANRYDLRDLTTPWWVLVPGINTIVVTPTIAGTVAWSDAWI
jgi:hypothetical protein